MKKIILLVCVLLFLLALTLPTLYFYQGRYWAQPAQRWNTAEVSFPTPPAPKFTESPERRTGTLLIDRAHENQFTLKELSLFIERVLSRGFRIEYFESKEKEKEDETKARLEEKLRLVDALAVMLPLRPLAAKEVEVIKTFADKGGKLLLIADPTRRSEINSLANRVSITFPGDYLYNLKESEGNFRNILVSQFKKSDLTKGLKRIVLYSASSISPSEWGLAFTDENTFSNIMGSLEVFAPMLLSPDNRVLAISDLTFMIEPYNALYDNNYLLSNVADWLTLSERRFWLSDFPYFFRQKIGIELSDSKFLDQGLRLKTLLERKEKTSELSEFKGKGGDRVFLGLLSHAGKVKGELEAGGISITTDGPVSLKIEGIGPVYRPDISLLYLYPKEGEKSLILLADKEEGLKLLIDGLDTGEFRQWLVRDYLALRYPPAKPEVKK